MDIRKFRKENSKEQSDKSSGEESDTEESLCPDKSKTFTTCPVSNKLSAQQRKKCYKKS